MKIKKNDTVKVLTGRDAGKTGRVLSVSPASNKALVEGINFVKKHSRKTQNNPQGGIINKESMIDLSNITLVCPRCNQATRVGFSILADKSKVRQCRECKETF